MHIDLETQEEKRVRLNAGWRSMRGETLHQLVEDFIARNEISSPETIYQMDHVIEDAYEFIEQLCNVVGYKVSDDEED
jgi:uncharacterized protein YheU (UPF0270 family)